VLEEHKLDACAWVRRRFSLLPERDVDGMEFYLPTPDEDGLTTTAAPPALLSLPLEPPLVPLLEVSIAATSTAASVRSFASSRRRLRRRFCPTPAPASGSGSTSVLAAAFEG